FFTSPPPPTLPPLSLHDALPISALARETPATAREPGVLARETRVLARKHRVTARELGVCARERGVRARENRVPGRRHGIRTPLTDRKSTRLNSSHVKISYAVFCL